ncbi:MAG: hypothetical protein H7211_09045 [Aquabacterium sp.]|nr:hypothetical protein [Ferruginibacter sp.]
MKKRASTLFGCLGKSNMAIITAEVKETIAFGAAQPCQKIFTSADLWQIHRQTKIRNTRRYF